MNNRVKCFKWLGCTVALLAMASAADAQVEFAPGLGAQQGYMHQDRQAKVAVTVAHLWLDTYRYRETIWVPTSETESPGISR